MAAQKAAKNISVTAILRKVYLNIFLIVLDSFYILFSLKPKKKKKKPIEKATNYMLFTGLLVRFGIWYILLVKVCVSMNRNKIMKRIVVKFNVSHHF